jgi:lysophospholipase L1-like esterase
MTPLRLLSAVLLSSLPALALAAGARDQPGQMVRPSPGTLAPTNGTRTAFQTAIPAPGCVASGTALGTRGQTLTQVRASTATVVNDGTEATCSANQLRVDELGYVVESARTQYDPHPDAPVTEPMTLTSSATSYTTWVEGVGTAALAAGTATATGLPCDAIPGTPCVYTVTGTGTVTKTVVGALTFAQTENGPFRTSKIHAAGARPADAPSIALTTAGIGSAWCMSAGVYMHNQHTWSATPTYGLAFAGATFGAANTAALYVSASNIRFEVRDAAAAQRFAGASFAGWPQGACLVGCVANGVFSLYRDGTEIATAMNGAGTGILGTWPTTMQLGRLPGAGVEPNGSIRSARVCKGGDPLACGCAAPLRVAAVGDSITANTMGYITYLRSYLGVGASAYTIANYAVSGWNTTQMLSRWTGEARPTRPRVLILMGGINDVVANATAEAIEGRLQQMMDEQIADGGRVVALTMTPWKNAASYTAGREVVRAAVNAWTLAYCAAHVQAACVDTSTALDDGTGALAAAYDSGDGLHPDADGHLVIYGLARAAGFP